MCKPCISLNSTYLATFLAGEAESLTKAVNEIHYYEYHQVIIHVDERIDL